MSDNARERLESLRMRSWDVYKETGGWTIGNTASINDEDVDWLIRELAVTNQRITALEKTYLPKIGRKRIIWQNGLCEEHFLEDVLLESPILVRAARDRLKEQLVQQEKDSAEYMEMTDAQLERPENEYVERSEMEKAAAAERERCAKIAEARVDVWDNLHEIQVAQDIAAAIRRPPQEEADA